jgi:hypothetical protein
MVRFNGTELTVENLLNKHTPRVLETAAKLRLVFPDGSFSVGRSPEDGVLEFAKRYPELSVILMKGE